MTQIFQRCRKYSVQDEGKVGAGQITAQNITITVNTNADLRDV